VLVFTGELEEAAGYLRELARCGVDAVLVQDVGAARLARAVAPGLALHASTQMTVTSPEGVRFARSLGVERVVLARELSLREIRKFDGQMPLEVFVHGALCVAYSGQCLTSEALGQRSANRGECAQACRMPYRLVVDGEERDLGDRRYLLSPQDLAGADDIPALIEAGVTSFKIEGRLKSPEYVAAVTGVYRRAIDRALAGSPAPASPEDRYALEMTFSRGLFTGWIHGVDHQQLVAARFPKKRGPLAGVIRRVGPDWVEFPAIVPLRPGDGVAFDTGGNPDDEQGGRIFRVEGDRVIFGKGRIDFSAIRPGNRVWKTDDPALSRALRATFAGRPDDSRSIPVRIRVSGRPGEPLRIEAEVEAGAESEAESGGIPVSLESSAPLDRARTAPLTPDRLRQHLGKLSGTGYRLGELDAALEGEGILPIAALNDLRRRMVAALDAARAPSAPVAEVETEDLLAPIRAERGRSLAALEPEARLAVLCRTEEQIAAALRCGVRTIYADFEDLRRYREAVAAVRSAAGTEIFLATPRIQKAGEEGFFKLIAGMEPDGVLVRNVGGIEFFRGTGLRLVGDFSLNVANPLSAELFVGMGVDRVTVSYDLNIDQVAALLAAAPPGWFELTIHQQMPMFHMEHCVFAAFLSDGTDHTNCGRPCDRHRVELEDRTGMRHPLRADVGCRNTLFNAVPQTGAREFRGLFGLGLRHYRVELTGQDPAAAERVIRSYQDLLAWRIDGEDLWRELRARDQLGVTRGTYRTR
jgi:putative protease